MELVLATSHTNRVSWSSTRLQRPFHASPPTKIWASYVFCSSFPLNGKTFCCSCESCEKNHSQRKTPYLQAQKSQWSSEHKELRSASAASATCLQRVLGWCRIFLEVAKGVTQKLKPWEAHRFCRWLPGAALAKTPSLKGIAHLRFIWTPLATLPKKVWPKTMWHCCANWCKMGWQKEKQDSFILAAGDSAGWRFGKCLERTAWDRWASCQPLLVTRSSTAICYVRTTWTRSLAWNAFFEL